MDAQVIIRRAGVVTVAALTGDLVLGRAGQLRAELLDVLRERPAGVVIDLSGVSSCDLPCLRAMAKLRARAAAFGVWVRVAAPPQPVARLLEVTGLSVSLPVYPDVERALRGRRPAAVAVPCPPAPRPPVPRRTRAVPTAPQEPVA